MFKTAQGCKNWLFFSTIVSSLFAIIVVVLFFVSNFLFLTIMFLFTTASWLLTVFLLFFFRDPDREIGEGIVSPADGKICSIEKIKNDDDIGECIRISVFMNLYDVHVNRVPSDGIIKDIKYIKGSYLPAFCKDSDKNERVVLKIQTNFGLIKVVQIAGIIARRIVTYVEKGDKLKKGDKIGIIRLGSRVDVYLPKKIVKRVCVEINEKVYAGVTKIAEIND